MAFADIMQQVIDAGGSPEEAAREAAMVSENQGIQVTQKQLSQWTRQARSIEKIPTPAVTPPKKMSPEEIGRHFRGTIGGVAREFTTPGETVGSFFKGLFGG